MEQIPVDIEDAEALTTYLWRSGRLPAGARPRIEVLAGANFELSNVTRGEIGVGYLRQSYDDPAFKDIEGFGARGQVEWFPTQLTTVTFTASRVIEDSGIPGSAGYINTSLGAQIDHELLRNVILTGQLAWGDDDYDTLDREDKRLRAGVSATYLLNRGVGLRS